MATSFAESKDWEQRYGLVAGQNADLGIGE